MEELRAPLLLEGVVLAAGLGRRSGGVKACLDLGGRPLVWHAVDGLRRICRRVVVVAGFQHDLVAAALEDVDGVEVVTNPAYREDMIISVQCGVEAVSATVDGVVLTPVDCPVLPEVTAHALVQAFQTDEGRAAIVPEHGGRGGHPVILPMAALDLILEAGPPETLRTILRRIETRRIPVDSPLVLLDIDTPDDLEAARHILDIDPGPVGELI